MSSANKCLTIIPTFNEVENIDLLVERLLVDAPSVDILVVDDNSPDGTARLVKEKFSHNSRVHLLNRAQKEGLALAYRAGFEWGLEKGYEYFIQMDADFSHDPLDTMLMAKKLMDHDVIIASRYTPGGKTSGWGFHRKFISRGGNTYARLVLKATPQDMTGGFNGWSKKALEAIDFRTVISKGYAYQVEMKYRALKAGFRPYEFPIHFRNRVRGTSKMTSKIIFEAAYRVLRLRMD